MKAAAAGLFFSVTCFVMILKIKTYQPISEGSEMQVVQVTGSDVEVTVTSVASVVPGVPEVSDEAAVSVVPVTTDGSVTPGTKGGRKSARRSDKPRI